jgi:hypothetical protein
LERLNNGDDLIKTITEELPRYNKGVEKVSGVLIDALRLAERRNSEILFFCKDSTAQVLQSKLEQNLNSNQDEESK